MIKTIQTKRLILKPFLKEDLFDLSEMLINEKIKKTYMIPDFKNQEELKRMVERIEENSTLDNRFVRGIYRNHKLIGIVNDVEINEELIELGYAIHPNYWNQGYASEMLKGVIEELFKKHFTIIRTGAFIENKASIRVMEKCNMRKINKEDEIEYQGMNHKCIYYEIRGGCHEKE